MKISIGKLLMTNGPEDLQETYHMSKEAAVWASNLSAIEISYFIQLLKAAKIHAIIHEEDHTSPEETESL